MLYDTSCVTTYDIKDLLAKRQTPQSKPGTFIAVKESLLTQELRVKGEKGLQRKVLVFTSVSVWLVCKRVGSIYCIILRLCLYAMFVQELEVFAALY